MLVDGRPLRLEPLTEAHIGAVSTLEKEINPAPWSEKAFRNELGHPHGIFLVATLDGKVIGYGGVWLVVDEAHITTVSVATSYRRKRIGREIVCELLRQARDRGMVCATLEVRAGNEPAIALYKQLGFNTAATRKAYYPDNREDALVMWLYQLEAFTG